MYSGFFLDANAKLSSLARSIFDSATTCDWSTEPHNGQHRSTHAAVTEASFRIWLYSQGNHRRPGRVMSNWRALPGEGEQARREGRAFAKSDARRLFVSEVKRAAEGMP